MQDATPSAPEGSMNNDDATSWGLLLIAALWVLFGGLGLGEYLVKLIQLDLLGVPGVVVSIFVIGGGIGILHGNRFVGAITRLYAWGFLIMPPIAIVLNLLDGSQFSSISFNKNVFPIPLWVDYSIFVILFLIGLWMEWVLRRKYQKGFFETAKYPTLEKVKRRKEEGDKNRSPESTNNERRNRSWLGDLSFTSRVTLLATAAIATLIGLGLGFLPEGTDKDEMFIQRGGERHLVYYGTRFGRLSYVVFIHQNENQPEEGETENGQRNTVDQSHDPVLLHAPDGTTVPLPGHHQLYEIEDGKLITSNKRVTLDQLKSFLHSNPETYGIQSLLNDAGSDTSGRTPTHLNKRWCSMSDLGRSGEP